MLYIINDIYGSSNIPFGSVFSGVVKDLTSLGLEKDVI